MNIIDPHAPFSSQWKDRTDTEVWDAIKRDNKDAFRYTYKQHVQALYNFGMRIYYDGDIVSETIQDLFVDIWNQRHNLCEVKNSKFYLFKAFRYKIFKKIIKDRKNNLISIEDLDDRVMVTSPHEDGLIKLEIDDEKKFLIASKISKLPDRQREIINLYFYENYSYEQISELMAINQRSVYTLIWKALTNLRKYLVGIKR